MACLDLDPRDIPPDQGTPAELLEELADSDVRPLLPWEAPESRIDRLEVEAAACRTGN